MGLSVKRLEAVERAAKIQFQQDIKINYETYEIKFLTTGKEYIPSETGKKFHADISDVKAIMGPFGSGKTTIDCMDLLIRACKMPKCLDGIRRVRSLILRNTFDQLKRGVYDTWTQWFADLGQTKPFHGNKLEYYHKFNDGNGVIDWQVWFIAIDKMIDIKKIKSFNATNAFINEINEMPRVVLNDLVGRLGRYPLRKEIDYATVDDCFKNRKIVLKNGMVIDRCPYWDGIGADLNPPDPRNYVYTIFEKEQPEGFKMFKQPAGLIELEDGSYEPNPNCDNYGVGINEDYYMKMVPGHTKEFINVYCMGQYGIFVPGKKVYPQYNDDIHSIDKIDFDPDYPVIFSFDGGFTPACLISQMVGGQLRAIKEFTTDRMYLGEFAEYVVAPFRNSKLVGYNYETTGDPAINELEEDALKDLGFDLKKAATNNIEERVQAQAEYLNKMVGGEAAFIVSREGCPELRAGFNGEYGFKEIRHINESGNPDYKEIPNKTHPTSDIHDCAQYAALHFTQNLLKQQHRLDGNRFISAEKY